MVDAIRLPHSGGDVGTERSTTMLHDSVSIITICHYELRSSMSILRLGPSSRTKGVEYKRLQPINHAAVSIHLYVGFPV